MVDTHCHLDFAPFNYHEVEYLKRAAERGVTTIINPGTGLIESERAVALARKFPNVYAAVGIHPTSAKGFDITMAETFRGLAEREKVVAIGEVGLDYYQLERRPDEVPSAREQQLVFEQFCSLAVDLHLPVIVHARGAYEDALAIVEGYIKSVPFIFHSFDGNASQAAAILEVGAYIGLNNMISYPKNEELRQIVKELPLDRILLETDSPFLPPQERRGEHAEPADCANVAEIIAEIRNITVPIVERSTNNAVKTVFQIEV